MTYLIYILRLRLKVSKCCVLSGYIHRVNEMSYRALLCLVLFLLLQACEKQPSPPIKIGINPWPGYEFIYLADKKGFFKEVGLNIEVLQLVSLADTQRAYTKGQVDGLASTLIEAVQAEPLGGKPLKVVLIPDYSNGGDVIISVPEITNVKQLEGKKVGAEISSLGIYVLERALNKAGLALKDVSLINTEQAQGEKALQEERIDAFVSYPPISVKLLRNGRYHKIFGSDEIPKEIIDTVAFSEEVIDRHPGFVEKFQQAWQMALDYAEKNKDEAYQIMAQREGISLEEFSATLDDLIILNAEEQARLFESPDVLQRAVINVCETMVHVKSIEVDCESYPDIIYRKNK